MTKKNIESMNPSELRLAAQEHGITVAGKPLAAVRALLLKAIESKGKGKGKEPEGKPVGKAKGKSKSKSDDDDDEADDEADDEEEETPPPKAKGKSASAKDKSSAKVTPKSKKVEDEGEDEDEDEDETPKAKGKVATPAKGKAAPKSKKAEKVEEEDEAPKARAKGKAKGDGEKGESADLVNEVLGRMAPKYRDLEAALKDLEGKYLKIEKWIADFEARNGKTGAKVGKSEPDEDLPEGVKRVKGRLVLVDPEGMTIAQVSAIAEALEIDLPTSGNVRTKRRVLVEAIEEMNSEEVEEDEDEVEEDEDEVEEDEDEVEEDEEEDHIPGPNDEVALKAEFAKVKKGERVYFDVGGDGEEWIAGIVTKTGTDGDGDRYITIKCDDGDLADVYDPEKYSEPLFIGYVGEEVEEDEEEEDEEDEE